MLVPDSPVLVLPDFDRTPVIVDLFWNFTQATELPQKLCGPLTILLHFEPQIFEQRGSGILVVSSRLAACTPLRKSVMEYLDHSYFAGEFLRARGIRSICGETPNPRSYLPGE